MAAEKAKQGWRARLAERRAERRQRRAWRRDRRKASIDAGAIGAPASSSFRHGQAGPAGQQHGGGGSSSDC
jgi:hypothetical protein